VGFYVLEKLPGHSLSPKEKKIELKRYPHHCVSSSDGLNFIPLTRGNEIDYYIPTLLNIFSK
jgi:hypothetical protein